MSNAPGWQPGGAPSYRVDGEIFWDEDRIDAPLRRLQGNMIDEALLTKVLARPASVGMKA